jgi:hypothetical protein
MVAMESIIVLEERTARQASFAEPKAHTSNPTCDRKARPLRFLASGIAGKGQSAFDLQAPKD